MVTRRKVCTEIARIFEQFANTCLPIFFACIQARKSPTVDGKVERNSDGKEIRFPVILTFREKEIARRIVLGFKQWVCGFDILRVQEEGHSLVSYVCGKFVYQVMSPIQCIQR